VDSDRRPSGPPWDAWLLLGPTGSGKTPLGRLFEHVGLGRRRCRHFDFGAELRDIASGPRRARALSAEDEQIIRRSLETGALLEDDEFPIALHVLGAFVRREGVGGDDLLVLNGLPRHVGQARMMEDMIKVLGVVSLEAGPEVVRERIRLDTGGDRTDRQDDELRAIRRKLVIFRMRTLPLIEYYENREVPVLRLPVGVRTTAGEMAKRVVEFAAELGLA
jgi:adenylate kinase